MRAAEELHSKLVGSVPTAEVVVKAAAADVDDAAETSIGPGHGTAVTMYGSRAVPAAASAMKKCMTN